MKNKRVIIGLFVLWPALTALSCAAINLHTSFSLFIAFGKFRHDAHRVGNGRSDIMEFNGRSGLDYLRVKHHVYI